MAGDGLVDISYGEPSEEPVLIDLLSQEPAAVLGIAADLAAQPQPLGRVQIVESGLIEPSPWLLTYDRRPTGSLQADWDAGLPAGEDWYEDYLSMRIAAAAERQEPLFGQQGKLPTRLLTEWACGLMTDWGLAAETMGYVHVEVSGTTLFSVSPSGMLSRVDLSDPTQPVVLSRYQLDRDAGRIVGMEIWQGSLAILQTTGRSTEITVLDVQDAALLAVQRRLRLEGAFADAQIVDGQLRLAVTNAWAQRLDFDLHSTVVSEHEYYDSSSGLGVTLLTSTYETREEYVARLTATARGLSRPGLWERKGGDEYQPIEGEGEYGVVQQPAFDPLSVAAAITTVVALDVRATAGSPVAMTSFFTRGNIETYATGESLYVFDRYSDLSSDRTTTIHRVTFSSIESGPAVDLAASGTIEGGVLNQFGVDEHGGHLRLVVEAQGDTGVVVLREEAGLLDEVGRLAGIAPGEQLYAVRFSENWAYFVTFPNRAEADSMAPRFWRDERLLEDIPFDPLFVVDVSDPTAPTLAGSLTTPGFSDHIELLGQGHLLTVGRVSEGLQVSVFSVVAPDSPQLLHRHVFADSSQMRTAITGSTWVRGDGDPSALGVFPELGLLTVPMRRDSRAILGGGERMQRIEVLSVSVEEGFVSRGVIDHDTDVVRVVVIDGYLVAISESEISVHHPAAPGAAVAAVRLDGNATEGLAAPLAVSFSSETVPENTPAGSVCGVFGWGAASGSGAGGTVTFTLVAGTGDADNEAFFIEGNQLRSAEVFDYESKQSYSIRVRLTGARGRFVEEAFTITVGDVNEAPTEVALGNTTVSDDAGPGIQVGVFSTSDPDSGDSFSYQLVAGMGGGDNGSFSIVDGILVTRSPLDVTSRSSYSILVRSSDSGGLSVDQSFVISVRRPQVGDAYILFNTDTGEFRMNPGHTVAGSLGVNSFGIEMDPAIGILSTNVNDYYFPSGVWPLFFPQTGANPGNAFGSAFQTWSLPNVNGQIAPSNDSLNQDNLVIGSPWVTQTGGRTGSTGAAIPGTTAVYASSIPGYEGLPEFSFGTVGPLGLTESEALAALGATGQGDYARGNRIYSLQGVVGVQSFRIFVGLPEPRREASSEALSPAVGAEGMSRGEEAGVLEPASPASDSPLPDARLTAEIAWAAYGRDAALRLASHGLSDQAACGRATWHAMGAGQQAWGDTVRLEDRGWAEELREPGFQGPWYRWTTTPPQAAEAQEPEQMPSHAALLTRPLLGVGEHE